MQLFQASTTQADTSAAASIGSQNGPLLMRPISVNLLTYGVIHTLHPICITFYGKTILYCSTEDFRSLLKEANKNIWAFEITLFVDKEFRTNVQEN